MKSNGVIKDSLEISPSKGFKKGDLVIIDNRLSFMNGEIGIITRVSRKKRLYIILSHLSAEL